MRKHSTSEKHVFYVEPSGISGTQVALPEGEAHHASRVLRLEPGDVVRVVDGEGHLYRVRLDAISRKGAVGMVVETLESPRAPEVRVTLAVGLLKHAGRYETMLEKVTELGVSRIVPLVTERCERGDVKEARSHGVLVAAMKQSGSARLPLLETSTPLDRFLGETIEGTRIVCHETGEDRTPMVDLLRVARSTAVTILVGPEGGFSDGELAHIRSVGYTPASLGPTRLRTETAAITAAALVLLS